MLNNHGITEKIRQVMEQDGHRVRSFARKIGMDHGNLSRLLDEKRNWSLEHLKMVAKACDCHVTDLLPIDRQIPIVAEIGADGQFTCVHDATPLGHAPLPTILARGRIMPKQFFALKLKEEVEPFPAGSLLYVKRDTTCLHRDWVVCSRESGVFLLSRVDIQENSITLSQRGQVVVTLPKTHLKLCDRVESVIFPLV
jgi:DNA-binding Xre family transcriptional regulator